MTSAFVHVPKCAGSTLREELGKFDDSYTGPRYFDDTLIGRRELVGASPSVVCQLATRDELASIVAESKFVMGHLAAHSLVEAGATDIWVTVREPRARLLSLYRYWQHQAPNLGDWGERGARIRRSVDSDLRHFLESDLVRGDVSGDMARYLLSSSMRVEGADGSWRLRPDVAAVENPSAIAAALDELRPHLAGAIWSRDVNVTLRLIAERCGMQVTLIDAEKVANPTPSSPLDQRMGPIEIGLLDRATRADRFVLDWLMDERILDRRTQAQLDAEFAGAARKHGIEVLPNDFV